MACRAWQILPNPLNFSLSLLSSVASLMLYQCFKLPHAPGLYHDATATPVDTLNPNAALASPRMHGDALCCAAG